MTIKPILLLGILGALLSSCDTLFDTVVDAQAPVPSTETPENLTHW